MGASLSLRLPGPTVSFSSATIGINVVDGFHGTNDGPPPLELVPDSAYPEDLPELELVPDQGTCAICLDDVQGPLQLKCLHTFCGPCLEGQLRARWHGSRLTFGYLNCGLCRVPLASESLVEQMTPHLELKRRADEVAVQKFCEDGLHEQLSQEMGRLATEEEVQVRAVAEMTVFQCCDCQEPYCAGKVDCAGAHQTEASLERTRCPGCEWVSSQQVADLRCMGHGHKFAMFKCDSCCSFATWNCHSNHYCERCHSNYYEAKDYPCPGPGKCPLGIPHPPNQAAEHGTNVASFCIGCTACLGCTELPDGVSFNEKNMFGFPERQWKDFCSGLEVLQAIGEEEVRARLKFLEPALVPEQDALSATLCADWLLPLELSAFIAAQAQAARRLQEAERQQQEWRERERRECEQELEQERKDVAAMDKELLAPAPADDWAVLKSSREQSRATTVVRAAVRQVHVTAKAARMVRKLSGARQQRYQQRGGRHKVDGLECGLDEWWNEQVWA